LFNLSVKERLKKTIFSTAHSHIAESANFSSASPVKQMLTEQWFAQWKLQTQ